MFLFGTTSYYHLFMYSTYSQHLTGSLKSEMIRMSNRGTLVKEIPEI